MFQIVGGRGAAPEPAGEALTLPQTLQSQSSGFALEPLALRALVTYGGRLNNILPTGARHEVAPLQLNT
jgi:hypothetical protein